MTIALLFLMGYQFWGGLSHEITGVIMLVLFITHHFLNGSWHKNLGNGKYTPLRTATLIIDILVFAAMLIQMYSGIVMSQHVFAFLNISGGMMTARRLHIIGAFWGFALMSIHLGFHMNVIFAMLKKALHITKTTRLRRTVLVVSGLIVAAYGIYEFISRGLFSNMFLQNEFILMDFNESKLKFYLAYLAVMELFAFFGYYFSMVLKLLGKTKKKEIST